MQKETVPKQKERHALCSSLLFLGQVSSLSDTPSRPLTTPHPRPQLTQGQKPFSERKPYRHFAVSNLSMGLLENKIPTPWVFPRSA